MRYRSRLLAVIVTAGLFTAGAMGIDAPTTKPAVKPLPAKALIALDKLKPAISRPAAADGEVPTRAKKAVAKARELIDAGKYALAVPLLIERALGFAPNSAEVHRLLANAYIQLPDAGKALVHMRKAVELDGDNITAQVKLAQLFIAQKQNDQASVALRTALLCSQSKGGNPLTGEALFRLGRLLDEGGYWRASLDCFDALSKNIDKYGRFYASRPVLRSIVLRPQRLLTSRGELLLKLRQPAKASALLERAFNRDRTNAHLAGLIVDALASSGQFKEAEKFLVDLAGQAALRSKTPALAEKASLASGDKSMPMRIWKACQSAKRDSGELAVALARAADKLGAPDQGSAILQSVLDSNPGDVSVAKFMVALYAAQGKGDKVLEFLGKLLRADPARDDIVAGQLSSLSKAGVPKDFARKFGGKIASAPKDQRASLHYLTGRFGQLQGDESLALAQYVKAIDTDPSFLPTYAHLAEIYGKKSQKDKLAGLLKHLDKLPGGQESVASYYARGKVHLAMSNASEAEKLLLSARQMDRKHIPTLEALGDAMLLGGRPEAAAAYRLVAVQDPRRSGIRERLFKAYMAMRAFSEARKIADEALEKAPNDRDAKIMLVRVLVATGQNADASKLLDELKARTGDDRRLRLLAIRVDLVGAKPVMFKKDFDRAVASLEKITGSDQPADDAAFVLARVMMQNGRYARAAELWGNILKVRSDNTVLRARAEALMAAGKYEEASAAIRKMLAVLPNDAVLRDQLFKCLQLAGKNDQVDVLVKQQLSQSTDAQKAVSLRLKMLNFLQDAKLYDRMQVFMDDWIMVDSVRAEPLKRLKIQVYVLAEKYPQAVAYAEKLLVKSPGDHSLRLLLIDAMTKSKAYDKAHALLDKWINERPGPQSNRPNPLDPFGLPKTRKQIVAELQGLKAGLYASAGKFDKANAYVADCLKEDPANLNVRVELIAALDRAKEYDTAMARLDAWIKALTGGPAATKPASTTRPVGDTTTVLAWCRETTVRVLVMKKEYDKAIARASEYLNDAPNNVDLLRLRSSALNEARQPAKALEDMRKMYKLQPDFSGHWNNLGYQLADLGLELTEAEKLIRRSLVAIGPSSINYVPPLDSLAWSLYKQGKLHAAGKVFLEVIRRSREQKYSHPILFDHAGDGFYRLGWTAKAVDLWTKAVKLAAEDKTDAREVLDVRRETPGKIKAVKAGKSARVAPLGKGVKIEDK